MPEQPMPLMRDIFRVSHAFAVINLDRDRATHERLLARRDDIRDKLRSGLTALNGGSLVALMAALNGDGTAAGWIGIDVHNAKWIAASFALGLVAAGIAYRLDENSTGYEMADSINRVGASERQIALYEGEATKDLIEKVDREMKAYGGLPVVGHRVQIKTIWALAVSQFFWATGIFVPLSATLWPT